MPGALSGSVPPLSAPGMSRRSRLAHLVMLEEALIHYDNPARVAGFGFAPFWVGSVVAA